MPLDTSDLRQVGEFNYHFASRRRLMHSPKNPMDKCTIVSILPKIIDESKWTIAPAKFHIEPGTYDNPAVLVVGGASWWRELDLDQPMLEIPVGSVQLAESIVKDYCNGMIGCDMDMSMPGLFFVLGVVNPIEVKMKYRDKLNDVKMRQDNWFKVLVNMADALWARGNGNPLAIDDTMRLAARGLNLDDKPWLRDFALIQLVKCRACGAMKHPDFPVCSTCRAIDMTHPNAKDLKFAQ